MHDFIGNKKKFTMAFLGGSITEGAGSSSNENNYVSLVTKALQREYPNVEINAINAGIGGTTSALGLFRLERDVLSKNPDMVFVEFAVNDIWMPTTGIYMENILRQIQSYDSHIAVVFIYTTTVEMLNMYESTGYCESVKQHMKLAEYYHIPQIDVGYELYKKFGKSIEDFSAEYLIDGVHPNDAGYRGYADIIVKSLEKAEWKEIESDKPYLYGRKFKNPRLLMCEAFANDVWKLSDCSMHRKLPNYIYSSEPGAEFSLEFDGSILGIYHTIDKDCGIIEYSVDAGEWKELSMWDIYALEFNRPGFSILEENLQEEHHTVRIKNSGRKAAQSQGCFIRIGALTIG